MVKLLPLHHPLRVLEDICVLDQLTGGRVEYGVGRGIAAIEHFWFDGDWFNSHDRFDEALTLILQGLRTGRVDPTGGKHYSFPPIDVSMSTYQQPNPPFWYPGNPVTAGRFGLNLMWPGPIPQEAYDLYVQTWHEHAGGPVRADRPGDKPRVGVVDLIVVSHDEAEAKAIAARGWKGLFAGSSTCTTSTASRSTTPRRKQHSIPQAHAAFALIGPGRRRAASRVHRDLRHARHRRGHVVEQHVAEGDATTWCCSCRPAT